MCTVSQRQKQSHRVSSSSTDEKKQDLLEATGKLPDEYQAANREKSPADGPYVSEYMEPATAYRPAFQCKQQVHLRFEKHYDGWKLTGYGKDADGNFIIGGYVDSTGKTSWTENGKLSTRPTFVETTGYFDFQRHTFVGEWKAQNGAKGRYLSFYHQHLSSEISNLTKDQQTLVADADVVVLPTEYVKIQDNYPVATATPVRQDNALDPPINPEYQEMEKGSANPPQ